MEIIMNPIGYIESKFENTADLPRQSIYGYDYSAKIIIKDEFLLGIKGLVKDEFIDVIFNFHKSDKAPLIQMPSCGNTEMGVFAIRSPNRPNHIGVSRVKIIKIENNIIYFSGVDMLNKTPVLDIKPSILFNS